MTISAHPLRRTVLLATVAAAGYGLVASFAAPARAVDDTKPTPTCAGTQITDPPGDAVRNFTGTPLDPAGPSNMDITGVFFKDEAGEVTANIQISNLSTDVPAGSSAVSWYAVWTVGSTIYFVDATSDGTTTTFEQGTYDDSLNTYNPAGPTKGKLFTGEQGVVQIVIPAAAKGSEGQTLKTPYAYAYENISVPGVISGLVDDDRAPDQGNGKSYEVAECAAEAPAPGTGTTTPTATTPGVLPITLKTSSAKAAKGKKGKSLSFKLKSTEEVTGIKATFKKGSTSYGSGKLTKLNGSGTLKVKLTKALKKGTYKLQLKGSTAAGKGKATFSVKVR
jgi:hypothetical protein